MAGMCCSPSSKWLGILAIPADAILKTHLGIEVGVLVEQVVPESPAAKAGILGQQLEKLGLQKI